MHHPGDTRRRRPLRLHLFGCSRHGHDDQHRTADSAQTGPDTDTATVLATTTPPPAGLFIDKTNNAPLVNVGGTNLPTASEGSTVTFTLSYTHTGSASTDGTITDVLPLGLTYVANSATGSADFTFSGYTAATRTLTWTASEGVSASGSVTYQAKVDAGAAGREQPLENVATIDSSDTEPDSDVSDVFVAVPPLAETDNPECPDCSADGHRDPGRDGGPGHEPGLRAPDHRHPGLGGPLRDPDAGRDPEQDPPPLTSASP